MFLCCNTRVFLRKYFYPAAHFSGWTRVASCATYVRVPFITRVFPRAAEIQEMVQVVQQVATTRRPRDRTKADADTVTIGDGKCARRVFFGQQEVENVNRDDGMMIRTSSGDEEIDDKNIWTRAMLFGWTGLTVDR